MLTLYAITPHSFRSVKALILDTQEDYTFWDEIDFIIAIMEPIFVLLRRTDSSVPLMGKFYHSMHQVGQSLETVFTKPQFAEYEERKDDIMDAHMNRWEYMHFDYHSAGYALDPNFLSHADMNTVNNGEVFNGLKSVVKQFYGRGKESCRTLALQQYNEFRQRRGDFADPLTLELASKMAAHEWWDTVGGAMPELQKVACHVLSKTTSASACERNWSAFDAVQAPKRTRLGADTLTDLVYSRSNLRLQQRRTDPDYKQVVSDWIDEVNLAPAEHAGSDADVESDAQNEDDGFTSD